MENSSLEFSVFAENMLLLEHLQGGVVYSDAEPPFALRYVTEGLAQMSGYTQDELLTMAQMDIVWQEDIDRLVADVNQQLGVGDTFEVEYRLKRKDGSFVYVLDRAKVVTHDNGKRYLHCLLTDITELKTMEQGLRLNEEKYKLAIQHSGNVIFDYELQTQALGFSENYSNVFGCAEPCHVSSDEWIEEEYRAMVQQMFQDTLTQKTSISGELRVRTTDQRLVWAALTLTPVVLSGGIVNTIVGCLQNIDEHKREVAALTELSQKDGLTSVYNRVTMEDMIAQRLADQSHKQNYGLIIMDIDFFKQVNDQFGHATGDRILIGLTRVVEENLPEDALFGRLGGDEFIIFAPMASEVELGQRCAHIVAAVGAAFAEDECPITVSLGGALRGGEQDFHALYRSADLALYRAKNKGRNGYTVLNNHL